MIQCLDVGPFPNCTIRDVHSKEREREKELGKKFPDPFSNHLDPPYRPSPSHKSDVKSPSTFLLTPSSQVSQWVPLLPVTRSTETDTPSKSGTREEIVENRRDLWFFCLGLYQFIFFSFRFFSSSSFSFYFLFSFFFKKIFFFFDLSMFHLF